MMKIFEFVPKSSHKVVYKCLICHLLCSLCMHTDTDHRSKPIIHAKTKQF